MKKIFLFSVLLMGMFINLNADTVTHIYGKDPAVVLSQPPPSHQESESLFETAGYNQALVVTGFLGVIAVVGGFAYLLAKRRH
jgi:hypothetical protein